MQENVTEGNRVLVPLPNTPHIGNEMQIPMSSPWFNNEECIIEARAQ